MPDKQNNLRHRLSHYISLLLFAIFLIHTVEGTSFARNTSISGQVIDAETEIPLVDVYIHLLHQAEGVSMFRTGRTGEFRFDEILQGSYTLRFERVGYETLDEEIVVDADPLMMTIQLKHNPVELGEVVVTPGDEEHAHFEKNNRPEPFSAGAGSADGSDHS